MKVTANDLENSKSTRPATRRKKQAITRPNRSNGLGARSSPEKQNKKNKTKTKQKTQCIPCRLHAFSVTALFHRRKGACLIHDPMRHGHVTPWRMCLNCPIMSTLACPDDNKVWTMTRNCSKATESCCKAYGGQMLDCSFVCSDDVCNYDNITTLLEQPRCKGLS
jgi:hypothetical protein